MKRQRTLLIAILLSLACSLGATAAIAATGTSHARSASAAKAAEAHTTAAAHRSKHAHTACRTTTRKHRRKHPRHCPRPTRGHHGKRAQHTTTGDAHPQATRATPGRQSRRNPTTPLHAKGADHGGLQAAKPVSVSVSDTSTATIASMLATPCQNTELMPEAGTLQLAEEATLCLVNQERARNNELPLHANVQLAQVAQLHSEDMVDENYFSHTTPGGETQLERVLASGYIPNSQVGYTIGENIAWGTLYLATPSSIVAAWMASPEHSANILTSEYRDTGIGIDPAVPASLAEGQPGAMYTQDFGVIQE